MSKLERNPVKTTITNLTRKARTIIWAKKPVWLEPGQGVTVDYDIFTSAEGTTKEVLLAEIMAGHVAITSKMTDQQGRVFTASYCKPVETQVAATAVVAPPVVVADKHMKIFDPATGKPKEAMEAYLNTGFKLKENNTVVTPVSKALVSKGIVATTQYTENVVDLNSGSGIFDASVRAQPALAKTQAVEVEQVEAAVPEAVAEVQTPVELSVGVPEAPKLVYAEAPANTLTEIMSAAEVSVAPKAVSAISLLGTAKKASAPRRRSSSGGNNNRSAGKTQSKRGKK
ncbi:MAG: hypothetical protein WC910_08315 [Bacteroidales bacterium]|jgi:hypothetical protein